MYSNLIPKFTIATMALVWSTPAKASSPIFDLLREIHASGEKNSFPCDFGPDALTKAYGKGIPRTCLDVTYQDDDERTLRTVERCYYTYVPESITTADDLVPLVLDIHGLNGCPLLQASYSGWMELAETEGFVVVWPSGNYMKDENEENYLLGTCWNLPGGLSANDTDVSTLPCCCLDKTNLLRRTMPPPRDPDDPLFIKMVVDSVVTSFEKDPSSKSKHPAINTDRVYLAGHSNGCMTSLSVAALYSDTIAAVCCHSGTVITPFPSDYAPVPIWLAHGTRDEVIPIAGSTWFDYLPHHADKLGFWSANETYNYLARENECPLAQDGGYDLGINASTANETAVLSTTSAPTGCKQDVEFVAVYDAGHFPYANLPASIKSRFGVESSAIDTTALAWDFCRAHTLPPAAAFEGPKDAPYRQPNILVDTPPLPSDTPVSSAESLFGRKGPECLMTLAVAILLGTW